jgi:predicted membrane protein
MERAMNDLDYSSKRKPNAVLIALGLGAIIFGGVMLLGAFGVINSWDLIYWWWPIPFILVGLGSLMQPSVRWTSVLWIMIPVSLYAKQHRWVDFNLWAVLPPVLMLVAGGAILYRAFVGPMPRSSMLTQSESYIRNVAIFSGTDLRPNSHTFTGGEITNILGGVKLDLTATDIPPEGAVLDMYVVLGGVELHLPSNWIVKLDMQNILAGVSDNRRPTVEEKTRTLTLRGFSLLGGFEIRN